MQSKKIQWVSPALAQAPSSTSALQSLSYYSPLDQVTDVRLKSRSRSYVDRVGPNNLQDYYRFSLSAITRVAVNLSGLNANADVSLLNSQGRIIASATQPGLGVENITRNLAAGTYAVRVEALSAKTRYRLNLSGTKLKLKPASGEGDNSNHVVTDWNTIALNAIKTAGSPPPFASRNLAIVHAAIYDAVNSIRPTRQQLPRKYCCAQRSQCRCRRRRSRLRNLDQPVSNSTGYFRCGTSGSLGQDSRWRL